jgi:hypothetical protein
MTLLETITAISVPVVIESLIIVLKKRRLVKLYYLLKPQSTILKTKIKLLTVGDEINYVYYYRGTGKEEDPIKLTISKIDKNTITLAYVDLPKKYINLLSNGELIALDLTDY